MQEGVSNGFAQGFGWSSQGSSDVPSVSQGIVLGVVQIRIIINGESVMKFRYKEPRRSDYDTEEEYLEALDLYESALDDYCDEYLERYLD